MIAECYLLGSILHILMRYLLSKIVVYQMMQRIYFVSFRIFQMLSKINIEINMIWDLVEEYKKKNNADNEPWNLKEKIINDIYFMFYDVYNSMPDPFDDLIEIICSSKEDKIRYAEILYTADDKYVKYEGAILLAELGCTEKVIDYFENYRGYEREKVYGLMLDYYAGSDYEKAVETANNALKN